MSVSFSGMSSGINTGALVDSMIGVASIPQLMLKNKVASQRQQISSLQALNTQLTTLATQAKSLAKPDALAQFSTTATSDGVTAKAGAGATAGSIDVVVDRLATAQKSVTGLWQEAGTTFTITGSDGTTTEVEAATSSLDDVVKALNAGDAGVRAVKVAAGRDADGNAQYRLQVTSADTGATGAFTLHAGAAADIEAGTATDLFAQDGAATVTAAADASVRLYADTDAEQAITSATNTFVGLMPGVAVTVSKTSTDPVTVTVADDSDAQVKTAKGLVDAVTSLLSQVSSRTQVTTSSDGSVTNVGVLQGNSLVREIKNSILGAATLPVGDKSPSTIGIEITRYGTVTFDQAKFTEALERDPDGTMTMFSAIATRVQDAAEDYSDKYDGRLTKSIEAQQSAARQVDQKILEWDARLDLKRRSLTRQFVNMETQLNAMATTQSWLSAQVSAMTAQSSNK